MDQQKIILLNLSKGRIGEDSSALLGAMMITQIQLAAMSRVDIEEDTRKDFYLYVDEFQNFATDSFANILSEARKYRLNLIVAHQYIEQLGDVVKAAVFGNVGTMVVYRIGAADAAELIKEFEPYYMEEDLVNIPKYNAYTKLMIDGISSSPFSCMGLPPMSGTTGNVEKVIEYTRTTYASSKEDVEKEIRVWSGQATPAEEEVKDDEKRRKKRNKKKVKKIEKLLPEYEKLAKLGNADAKSIVDQLHQATKDLLENKDVDIGDIIGRDEDREDDEAKSDDNKPKLQPKTQKKEKTWSDVLKEQKAVPAGRQDNPQPQAEKSEKKQEKPKPKPKKSGKAGTGSAGEKPKGEFEITCDECGKKDHINFKHDPNKPIYCGDCLKKKRAEKNKQPKEEKKQEKEKIVSLREVQDKSVSLTHGQPVQLDDDAS
jgi:CxxC-x17-CxxC domain-containing protein